MNRGPLRRVAGHSGNGPRWIATLPDYIVHSYDILDTTTDIDGDGATIPQRVRQHATVLGVRRSGIFVLTDIWRDRDDRGSWRRHSTPLEAGKMPQQWPVR